jgi:hypothetical protein
MTLILLLVFLKVWSGSMRVKIKFSISIMAVIATLRVVLDLGWWSVIVGAVMSVFWVIFIAQIRLSRVFWLVATLLHLVEFISTFLFVVLSTWFRISSIVLCLFEVGWRRALSLGGLVFSWIHCVRSVGCVQGLGSQLILKLFLIDWS